MLAFLFGMIVAGAGTLWFRARWRHRVLQLEDEKQAIEQERQIVVEFMHRLVEAVGENLSRAELLQRIVHSAVLATGAMSACFFERTPAGRMRGAAVEGLFPPHRPLPEIARGKLTTRAKFIEQILRSEEFPADEGIVGEVVRTGRGVLVADAAADPRVVRHDDPALAVRSLAAVPVTFRDQFLGVLVVANAADGLPFSPADLSLVTALAEHAGMAIHNLGLLQLQLERRQLDLDLALAHDVQQTLLPGAAPDLPGFEVDGRYMPAQQIGGDIYDLIPLPAGRVGLVVADVAGKGIAAALLMAVCRTLVRQVAVQLDSPAQVLIEVNRALTPEMRPGFFITLVYAVVDPAAGAVTLARAGHERPLEFGADGRTAFIDGEGMALGLAEPELFAAALEERRVPLEPGAGLVLYTDGVTEAPNEDGTEFSGARLADVVRNLAGLPAREVNDGILAGVRRFTGGGAPRDDLTLVTVRRVPGS